METVTMAKLSNINGLKYCNLLKIIKLIEFYDLFKYLCE